MSIQQDIEGPFPFTRKDLEADNLMEGVQRTLAHFYHWRDGDSAAIAGHINRYTRQLELVVAQGRLPAVIGRRVIPGRRRDNDRLRLAREANYFGMYNLGEVPSASTIARAVDGWGGRASTVDQVLAAVDRNRSIAGVMEALETFLPDLAGTSEAAWLTDRLERLHRTLPEDVVRSGGMGKVIRALVGVLAIGAYDTLDDDPIVRREHLTRVVPGAYALGAAYVVVDDTLQDMPEGYVSSSDKQRCHQAILSGLSTGKSPDTSGLPDHPLVEEMGDLFESLLQSHPFEEYRHLYHAAEAMYLAQHRDAMRTVDDVMSQGLTNMYPDIVIKSGLSRVIANVIGRRNLDDGFYGRCVNTIVVGQFKDDLRDRREDRLANRLTPFTFPAGEADTNPLYDLFAYDAYVASQVFGGDEVVTDTLTYFGAVKLATYLSADSRGAEELVRDYEITGEIARFLEVASCLPPGVAQRLEPAETQIKDRCGAALCRRKQTTIDSRTFVADKLPYINGITRRHYPEEGATGLDEIIAYAMNAPGKRLRPALGLMLAEGLDLDTTSVEPFVVACELFHTASLLLDDLPAQDDATMRRGRPAAHIVFPEAGVQLAAVSMISTGFGLLAQLDQQFPAQRVTEVIAYVGTVLGPERLCKGQDMDLNMGKSGAPVSGDKIIEMYDLKTSTALEAALVPLMMLADRPANEVELVKRYAHDAGIVFQIRDDMLDLISSTESLGKDAGNDVAKVNAVRAFGLAEAERLMATHVDSAMDCCSRLPFDTSLLQGMVTHFATRAR